MSFGHDSLIPVLERIEPNLIVVEQDILLAEKISNFFLRFAAIISSTFASDELNIELNAFV